MTKTPKRESNATQEEAFEIIELACEEFELLGRAFDLINEVCETRSESIFDLEEEEADDLPEYIVN